jgi:hypothetical protein
MKKFLLALLLLVCASAGSAAHADVVLTINGGGTCSGTFDNSGVLTITSCKVGNLAYTPISTATTAACGNLYVASASLTLTLPLTTSVDPTSCQIGVLSNTGTVTVSVNGADGINGGSVGVGTTVPQAFYTVFSTDANHHWASLGPLPGKTITDLSPAPTMVSGDLIPTIGHGGTDGTATKQTSDQFAAFAATQLPTNFLMPSSVFTADHVVDPSNDNLRLMVMNCGSACNLAASTVAYSAGFQATVIVASAGSTVTLTDSAGASWTTNTGTKTIAAGHAATIYYLPTGLLYALISGP